MGIKNSSGAKAEGGKDDVYKPQTTGPVKKDERGDVPAWIAPETTTPAPAFTNPTPQPAFTQPQTPNWYAPSTPAYNRPAFIQGVERMNNAEAKLGTGGWMKQTPGKTLAWTPNPNPPRGGIYDANDNRIFDEAQKGLGTGGWMQSAPRPTWSPRTEPTKPTDYLSNPWLGSKNLPTNYQNFLGDLLKNPWLSNPNLSNAAQNSRNNGGGGGGGGGGWGYGRGGGGGGWGGYSDWGDGYSRYTPTTYAQKEYDPTMGLYSWNFKG